MPPKTADPVDPVDVIVTNADISTVIIKHGASNKEIIMKYVIKRLIRQIQIYWNRVCNKEIEVDILALLTEKFVSSRSIPEFLQAQAHFNGELPATMGHSNRQRPDGVIQFKYKNELCHLFIEIDADNKRHMRQREALKIWQDISCSVEGQSSNTSPGESISACVMRINTHAINCSGVQHTPVAKPAPSTESTVPDKLEMETDEVIGDEDKQLRKTYSTKHIDEVKQVFVTMHHAFARQITRVILAWLEYVFNPTTDMSKSSINKWFKNSNPPLKQDFCFWVGEYQINNSSTAISTQELNSKDIEGVDQSRHLTLTEIWSKIIENQKFNKVEDIDNMEKWTDLKILDDYKIDLDPSNPVCQRFYDPIHSWKQIDSLFKFNNNSVRSQGHWFRQLQVFQEYVTGFDKDKIADWIDSDQEPFMHVKTNVTRTRGNHGEKTTIKFTTTRKDKCEFSIDVGLFGMKIPRVSTEEFEIELNNFCKTLDSQKYDALPDFNFNIVYGTFREKKTLFHIWKSFDNALNSRKEVLGYNPGAMTSTTTNNLQNYQKWVTTQMDIFEDIQIKKCKKLIDLQGMWYSKHVAMICEKILKETDADRREFIAHVLFQNSRQDKLNIDQPNVDIIDQPNVLPLAALWPKEESTAWNINTLKDKKGEFLIPLLWDPLSGMLINAILFFIRGIKQSSPSGEKNFETKRTQIRNTSYIFRSIKALLEADAILPDLLANHAQDRISSASKNLNTRLLRSICDKELNQEFDHSLREYLTKLNSEHCVAFCKLIKCTDDSMLHWTAKMYQNEAFKDEISRNIRLFPLAGQAMILRMLAEAADDNSVVWKTNNEVEGVEHGSSDSGNLHDGGDEGGGGGANYGDPDRPLEEIFKEFKDKKLKVKLQRRGKWSEVLEFKTNIHKINFDHVPGTKNYATFHCIEVDTKSGSPKSNTNYFQLCDENDGRSNKFKFTIALIYYDSEQNVQGGDNPQNVYYYSDKNINRLSWHFGDGINLGEYEENASDDRNDQDTP
tara:strand:- start:220 stop:3249 length:3030 start_codon:yes stop_codon:yes gene_type:complete